MKPGEKRLVFEIDRNLHSGIRIRAAQSHMTLKNWVTLAIVKALNEENNNKDNNDERDQGLTGE